MAKNDDMTAEDWLNTLTCIDLHRIQKNLIISVMEAYAAEKVEKLRDALETLRDEQNGPPLERDKAHWQMAMDKTKQALADTEEPHGR